MINITKEQREALISPYRREVFRGVLLDKDNNEKGVEFKILGGSISVNADYEVKKYGDVELFDTSEIDTMSDKIQIYMSIDEFEWSIGVFMIIDAYGNKLELADETVKLQQALPLTIKVFHKGTLYIDALKWFIIEGANTIKFDIQSTDEVIPADIIIDNSKSLLSWFNHIADQINYTNLYVDSDGYFKSNKYIEPSFSSVGYRYLSDKDSIITPDISYKIDTYKVPNVFQRIMSRGDLPPLVSTYINDDPTSRFSTVYRGFEVTDSQTIDLISTQNELDLYVSRLALKSQQIEETVTFHTANMPIHEIYDIIELDSGVYEETGYTIELDHYSQMVHHGRRVIYGFEDIQSNSKRRKRGIT